MVAIEMPIVHHHGKKEHCRLFPVKTNPVQMLFLRSSRIRVDLLLYECRTTDKPEQYDRKAEKNLDGIL